MLSRSFSLSSFKQNLIRCSAWDEIHDVFGDGHEYDWALEADDEVQYDEENLKPDIRYQDVCVGILSAVDTDEPFFRSLNHLKYGTDC